MKQNGIENSRKNKYIAYYMINYFPVKFSFLDVYMHVCLCVCPQMQCKIFFYHGLQSKTFESHQYGGQATLGQHMSVVTTILSLVLPPAGQKWNFLCTLNLNTVLLKKDLASLSWASQMCFEIGPLGSNPGSTTYQQDTLGRVLNSQTLGFLACKMELIIVFCISKDYCQGYMRLFIKIFAIKSSHSKLC